MIYLDNAATTRVDPKVFDEMYSYFCENYANAYSIHSFGVLIREKVELFRKLIADYFNCKQNQIIFTSGATESNNWVIKQMEEKLDTITCPHLNHIITTKIEHDSILNACKSIEENCRVDYLDVDSNGTVNIEQLKGYLEYDSTYIPKSKILVSVMTANNEIGTIQPIKEIGSLCKKYGAKFHTDATQAISTMGIDVVESNLDFLSCSAHKFYGPKGIGILYIKEPSEVHPILFGGEQEMNLRAGTTNSPAIIGMGEAICLLQKEKEDIQKIKYIRDSFVNKVLTEIPDCQLNGSLENRVVGNANICFRGLHGAESLLMLLDMDGIIASSGSACNSSSLDPSHVLKAIGMSDEDAKNSIRFSFGKYNTIDEIDFIVESLKKNVGLLRG